MGRALVLWIALVLALPGISAAAPPPCADAPACEVACANGAGPPATCTALADALVAGRKVAPDRKRAAMLYRAACRAPADLDDDAPAPAAASAEGDPVACITLAELAKTGWLFDIERDAALHRALVNRAHDLAAARCTASDASGCAVAARAARDRISILPPGQADPLAPVRHAERGCTQAHDRDACRLVRELAPSADKEAEVTRLRAVAKTGLEDACIKDGVARACVDLGLRDPKIRAAADKLCIKGNVDACVAGWYQTFVDNRRDAGKRKQASIDMLTACKDDGHELCAGLAGRLVGGDSYSGLEADPVTAIAIGERRCALGDRYACTMLAEAYGVKGPEALRDPAKARQWAEVACVLTAPSRACKLCDTDPTVGVCQRRIAFAEHVSCFSGALGTCERVAVRFRDGTGVDKDIAAAARHLRRGCDGAEKSACLALDDLCVANPTLPDSVCEQALIHTDLFYEAEYQLAARGDAGLIAPGEKSAAVTASAGTVSVAAEASTGGGVRLERGKLDADLVVDIVLDRARQAAIHLVVDRLLGAKKKARPRYLSDLLDQGARLLADPSTLRREKFQDLGMTVVRAFVAANLVDGVYPGADELVTAPVIGVTVKGALGLEPGGSLPQPVHAYLVDIAYLWLGETRLFGRNPNQSADPPACPWPDGPGATLCVQLADRATVERALRVDKVLDGLRLAKGLREAGFDDLRRLIEAVSRSRTIADFEKTPGLNLVAWRSVLVAGSRDRIARLRNQLVDLRALTRPSLFTDTGPEISVLASRAAGARAMLDSASIRRLVVGSDSARHLMAIVRGIEAAAPKDGAATPVSDEVMTKLRKDATGELTTWGSRDVIDLGIKLDRLEADLDALRPAVDQLATAIADIEALFARFPGTTGVRLDVGALPLYAVGDLTRNLRSAATALATVEDNLRKVYPGEVQAQLQFARSATVRLLGFLDLMERVARSSRLTQTCGDIVEAIGTLGSFRKGEFTAPLYDVLEPVLGAIKTHEPMSLDLLFAVIARVRLDTLVGSLQGGGNACKKDGSVDCWTVKLIHALQESVEREGDMIRVDGGKFAQRLARHGDDFRKKHTWRGYFHLTVGFGALRSDPVDDTGDLQRTVPLVSEQIGFGFASPAVWKNRLTFKFGAAASGLLYRAVLDSEESNAIMVHPLFLAVDVGDLIEAYISPAMILVYPPTDTRDTSLRWGISAGISVPLSSYLEKL
jgi:TPR repeat protein